MKIIMKHTITCILVISAVFAITACSDGNTYSEREYQDLLDENRSLRNELRDLKSELDDLKNADDDRSTIQTQNDRIIGSWIHFHTVWADVEPAVVGSTLFSDSTWVFNSDGSFQMIVAQEYLDEMEQESVSESEKQLVNSVSNGSWSILGNDDDNTIYRLVTLAATNGDMPEMDFIIVNDILIWMAYNESINEWHFERTN